MTVNQYRIIMIMIAFVALIILGLILYFVLRSTPSQSDFQTSQRQSSYSRMTTTPNNTDSRDMRVLQDPLYPPLNRTESQVFNNTTREVANRNLYVPTNGSDDSFRLVGYLTNNDQNRDAGGNNWKLFARMKNRHEAEYYIIPANNNYDIKIPVTNEILVGDRLRDVYTIPNELKFKSPMLNETPYVFTEIKRTDFSDARYV